MADIWGVIAMVVGGIAAFVASEFVRAWEREGEEAVDELCPDEAREQPTIG